MFPEAEPRVNIRFLDSSALNMKGEVAYQLIICLKQGRIVILLFEGSKEGQAVTGELRNNKIN